MIKSVEKCISNIFSFFKQKRGTSTMICNAYLRWVPINKINFLTNILKT